MVCVVTSGLSQRKMNLHVIFSQSYSARLQVRLVLPSYHMVSTNWLQESDKSAWPSIACGITEMRSWVFSGLQIQKFCSFFMDRVPDTSRSVYKRDLIGEFIDSTLVSI